MTPSPRDRIDPECLAGLDAMLAASGPGGFAAIPDLVERRRILAELTAAAASTLPAAEGLTISDHLAPRTKATTAPDAGQGPPVPVRVYRPVGAGPRAPGILLMHGGGMVAGSIDQEEAVARRVATEVPAVVVSVGYRLAPEHPAPAAVHDCYAALMWLAASAAELGVDARRLAVFGRSAGGGLAAAVALLARDLGGPELRFQMPLYPMLDDRNTTASSHEIVDVGVWDRAANVEAWDLYLSGHRGDDEAVAAAVPARAQDLAELPPAFIDVGTVDLFRDEVIEYVARLVGAGVPVEFHLWPGVFHAAEKFAPDAGISRRIWDVRFAALRAALLA